MTEPLPYIVKLRSVSNEDAAPVVTEVKCLAYSPIDAITQAVIQTLGMGGTDSDKYRVEMVGPDLDAWRKMRAEEKKQEAKK